MAGKFSKLQLNTNTRSRETDPLQIFNGLTLRGNIENIWATQTEALSEWHGARQESDLVIQMNTGGGKTLVGLLVAKSLANETGGRVIYACPTKQLIEQTSKRATECSLEVAQYMDGQWTNREIYESAKGPCLTTYAALFNGKSIFLRDSIDAIIFDDAHVAYNSVRSAYTIVYERESEEASKIASLFGRYFLKNHSERFKGLWQNNSTDILVAPCFEVRRSSESLKSHLLTAGIEKDKNNLFAWEHLKDNIADCAISFSRRGVEITPASLPVNLLPLFEKRTRRVYLTATIPSSTEFRRTFGVSVPRTITPKGKSGEAQRLFVFPEGENDAERQSRSLELANQEKAAILVPSNPRAENWKDHGQVFERHHGQKRIDEFCKSEQNEKLILVARFDGIDLPGKSCRILILDGLPRGSSNIDRFCAEMLRSDEWAASTVAIRLIQGIGRIFRSNTDHGAVILADDEIQRWLTTPKNLKYFPTLLQQQILLGNALREKVEQNEISWPDAIEAVLEGDAEWDKFYEINVKTFEPELPPEQDDWLSEVSTREHEAYLLLWKGNSTGAATAYESLAHECRVKDPGLSAWYWHWAGSAWMKHQDNSVEAARCFINAANNRAILGRPRSTPSELISSQAAPVVTAQARSIKSLLESKGGKVISATSKALGNLKYGKPTAPTEEAIKEIGTLLGFDAARPDTRDEEGLKTGPDIIWRYPDKKEGAAFEAKTNKESTSQYRKKDDIGQYWDHIKYLSENHPGESFRHHIVGRLLEVSSECHPPDDLLILPLEELRSLIKRIQDMYEQVIDNPTGEAMEVQVQRWLNLYGLGWPHCIDNLESKKAVDLKGLGPD